MPSSSGNRVKRIDTFTPSSCHLFTYRISETGTPHRVIIDLLDKKIDLSLHISETFCTFAIVPIPKPCLWAGLTRSGDLYIGKALLDALCLTHRNLAVPKQIVKLQSNNDAHGYVVFMPAINMKLLLAAYNCGIYIHTGVGFGVARFDRQGDARASECGTSNR